jgi:hypothetical protein
VRAVAAVVAASVVFAFAFVINFAKVPAFRRLATVRLNGSARGRIYSVIGEPQSATPAERRARQ